MEEGWAFSPLAIRHLVQPSACPLTGSCCALMLETFYRHLEDDELHMSTRVLSFARMYSRDRYQILHLSWGMERLLDFEEQNQALLNDYAKLAHTIVKTEYEAEQAIFHTDNQRILPSEVTHSSADHLEGFHQWNGVAMKPRTTEAPDPYRPEDVHCTIENHVIPRSRLVLVAGSCVVCAQCCPNLKNLRLDADYDANLWHNTFADLVPFAQHEFVDHFMLYAVRIFFIDLLHVKGDYAARYHYHRRLNPTLADFERILPDAMSDQPQERQPYYFWMAAIQSRLGLPSHDSLAPRSCREALESWKTLHESAHADEAKAIEVVLKYYFLFACARLCAVPPNASNHQGRRRRRRSCQSQSNHKLCKVLGIPVEDAGNAGAINKAFRRKALELHPDKWNHLSELECQEKAEAFKELTNARDELLAKLP
jgi:hypothetical protein